MPERQWKKYVLVWQESVFEYLGRLLTSYRGDRYSYDMFRMYLYHNQ